MSDIRIGGSPVDIAVSGLRAQSKKIGVISSNIANAFTTRGEGGQPYRRQEVLLRTSDELMGGVRIDRVAQDDASDFKRILMPGHPDADSQGYVAMPNVDVSSEMVQLTTASRAYQANAAVLKRYQEMVDLTVELLR